MELWIHGYLETQLLTIFELFSFLIENFSYHKFKTILDFYFIEKKNQFFMNRSFAETLELTSSILTTVTIGGDTTPMLYIWKNGDMAIIFCDISLVTPFTKWNSICHLR